MSKKGIFALVTAITLTLCACATSITPGSSSSTKQTATTAESSTQSQTGGEASSSGDKEVLRVWLGTPTTNIKAHIDKFTEVYPQYELEFTEFEGQDYKTQTRIAVSSGTAPDVFSANIGALLDEFIAAGTVMDITGIANEKGWLKKIYPDYIDSLSKDGKLYAINYSGTYLWQALYYNKDFMDKNGITIPQETSIEEMAAISEQIRAAGMQPIAFGNKDMWPGILMFGDYLVQITEPSYIDKINSGEIKWNESEVLGQVFEAMQKIGQSGMMTVGYESQDHNAAINSWAGEKCAMLYNGAWWPGSFDNGIDDIKFTIGTASLPLYKAGEKLKGTQFWGSMAMIINSNTAVKDAAIDFVDYYINDDGVEALAKDTGTYTFDPEYNKTIELHPIFITEPFTKQLDLPKMNYADWIFPTPVIEELKLQIVDIFSGKVTPEQALKNMEAVHARES